MKGRVEVLATLEELSRNAADRIVEAAQTAVEARDRFAIALSGGTTPRSLYQLLATEEYAKRIDWAHVHVYWTDERCVPPTDRDSNYRMAHEALLAHVAVPSGQVHRIHGETDPEAAALAYDDVLRRTLRGSFDFVLLGLGSDGHTASLFPGLPALHEQQRWVMAAFVENAYMRRVTLTPPVINAAGQVVFMVAGADKSAALKRTLEGEHDPDLTPAQLISPRSGQLLWLVDEAAAYGSATTGR